MSRFVIAFCLAILLCVAAQAQVYTTVDINFGSGNTLLSYATARSLDFWGNTSNAALQGWHRIEPASGSLCASNNWFDANGPWSGSLSCGGASGMCYRGRNYAKTVNTAFYEQETASSQACFGGGGGCGCDLEQEGGNCPIVLNPGGGAWTLSGADVLFDLDADGAPEAMGWTGRGESLAFLAIDHNGNGVVDDGSELFGIGTLLANGERAANGFAALRQHDGNGDGVIDAADAIWGSLLLWTDANHDAVSQAGELVGIAGSFTALELEFRQVGRRDAHGNTLRYQAHARNGNARQPFYDVFFLGQ